MGMGMETEILREKWLSRRRNDGRDGAGSGHERFDQ